MKKFLILLALIVPFVTGCATIDSQVTINDNKTATITNTFTYSGNLRTEDSPTAIAIKNLYPKYVNSYSLKETYEKDLTTFVATKQIFNIEKEDIDLSQLGFTTNLPSKKFVEVKRNFFISSYNIDATINLKSVIDEFRAEENRLTPDKQIVRTLVPEYLSQYSSEVSEATTNTSAEKPSLPQKEEAVTENNTKPEFKTTFKITLPSFASYNNAQYFTGTTYSWTIDQNKPTNVKLQYVRYSGFAIFFFILVGIGLLTLIARKIKKHDAQKRADNINNIV